MKNDFFHNGDDLGNDNSRFVCDGQYLFDGGNRRVTDRISTYGLFIDPPLGRAGMTEAEAKATGRKTLMEMPAEAF